MCLPDSFAIFCITILQVFSGVSEIRCCHLFFLGFQSHLISDLTFLFVVTFSFGIAGAAVATVISPIYSRYRSYALFSLPVF